jgi:site-specific DNA recombinase
VLPASGISRGLAGTNGDEDRADPRCRFSAACAVALWGQCWPASSGGAATEFAAHWSPTGIREILHRRLYLGEVVYGQTRWERRGGTKRKVRVPESEWIKTTDPNLRLVSDDLWQAAHARLSASRAVYLTRNDGRPGRKPETGLESKYLLSGFLRCEACGGSMVITKRTGERGQPQVAYICATHRSRPTSCPVRNGLLADDIHARAVDALAKEIFTPERLQEAIAGIARQRAKTDTIDAKTTGRARSGCSARSLESSSRSAGCRCRMPTSRR